MSPEVADRYPILVLAPAKLTLSLAITGIRSDGMHLIRAEMVTVDLFDTLILSPGGSGLTIEDGGDDVPVGPDNLILGALELTGRRAAVHLIKRIPSQAGLGGGSADAGAVLRWAGFDDPIRASELGADVAFCVVSGRALVEGIGERVTPLPLGHQTFTLLTPTVPCPTAAVYRAWDEMGGPVGESGNDLEPAAIHVTPELGRWRDDLEQSTGRRPRLAGSGSTWFVEGAFPGPGRVVCRTTEAPAPATGVAAAGPEVDRDGA